MCANAVVEVVVGTQVQAAGLRSGRNGTYETSPQTSLPPSKTDGSSGGGPSNAHRRDSYLERMKDSILLMVKCHHG